MKKSDITEAMIDDGTVYLSVFAMRKVSDGDFELCPSHIEPDFYDVELRFFADDGEIIIIEEHNDLDFGKTQAMCFKLCSEIGMGLQETWEYA